MVCPVGEDEDITIVSTPSGFTFTGDDDVDTTTGDVVSPDETTKLTVTNEAPTTTDTIAMQFTGKVEPAQATAPEDISVVATVYPEDGTSPITVPTTNVSTKKDINSHIRTSNTYHHNVHSIEVS